MELGIYETRRTRRRRFWNGLFRWIMGLAVIVGAGAYAYEYGAELAGNDMADTRREMAALTEKADELRQKNARQRAAIAEEQARFKDFEERYARDVPTAEQQRLLELFRERQSAGVDAGRLMEVMGRTENIRACDAAPVSKRFFARTPLYEGAADSVSFADNTITVTAKGEPVLTAEGKPEEWFEPALPVKVTFTHIGGKTADVSGKLPLHQAMIVGDTEYRFTLVAGEKGFIRVTGDTCRYP